MIIVSSPDPSHLQPLRNDAWGIKNWFMISGVYRVMDACRKFGEQEGSVRVARGDSGEQL